MKKFLMMMALSMACASVFANDLAQADKLFEQNQFPQALQIYTKLANDGNAEAQQKLADMYWYGEAGAIDQAQAEVWFRKAAAQGNAKAVAALELIRQRGVRKNDIEFYTLRFDGGDEKFAKFGCVRPVIPDVSKSRSEVSRVSTETKAWNDCYNRYVAHMNSALPPGKAIPRDLLDLMNNDEIRQAQALMDKTYAAISAGVEQDMQEVNAKQQKWMTATLAFAEEQKKINNGEQMEYLTEFQKMAARNNNQDFKIPAIAPSSRGKN